MCGKGCVNGKAYPVCTTALTERKPLPLRTPRAPLNPNPSGCSLSALAAGSDHHIWPQLDNLLIQLTGRRAKMLLLPGAGTAALAPCWLLALLEAGGAAVPASRCPAACISSMPGEFSEQHEAHQRRALEPRLSTGTDPAPCQGDGQGQSSLGTKARMTSPPVGVISLTCYGC